ncbi:MAG: hypothetical protein IKJ83_00320 [Ruminococcus sp.]|nr:hypothetical protein [Ruminococcus sp.]
MANRSRNFGDSGKAPDNKAYTEAINDANNKNVQSLMNRLSAEDQQKVRSILQNPEETKKILSNPKVQELIRKFKGNG